VRHRVPSHFNWSLPSSGGVMNWNGRGNKLLCSDRRTVPNRTVRCRTVPALAFKALATTTKNFNQDNRRPILNSNQAPPGYKTDVTPDFRRGVVEPLALLGCYLTTLRHTSVPTPRIVYVGNQVPSYTAQHPTTAKASDKFYLPRQLPRSF
jgi:hypothetical protein